MRTYYIVLDNSQVSLIQPIIIRRYVIGHYSYNIVLIERKETAHIRSNKVSYSKRSDSKKSTKILKLHQGICQHWFSFFYCYNTYRII
jgi:hypothetical protein